MNHALRVTSTSFLIVVLVSGCLTLGVGEGAIRVEGHLEFRGIPEDTGNQRCFLELLAGGNGQVLSSIELDSSSFLETFVIPPSPGQYRFRILCDSFAPYQSNLILLRSSTHYDSPVDLGEIELLVLDDS